MLVQKEVVMKEDKTHHVFDMMLDESAADLCEEDVSVSWRLELGLGVVERRKGVVVLDGVRDGFSRRDL
jgi:hypothetical protein